MDRERFATYEYSPLDLDSQQIRLLTLLPGTFDSPTRITIETFDLTSAYMPKYEALSNTWGSTADPDIVHAVGKNRESALAVTQSLATALPYFRFEYEPRTLWIDAICINQQDIVERSQ